MAVVARDQEPNIRTRMALGSRASTDGEKIPRRRPVFPMSAERELARVYLTVAVSIEKMSKPYIDRIANLYGTSTTVRQDAIGGGYDDILEEYEEALMASVDYSKLIKGASRAGKVARGISVRDWKALVQDGLGETISEPFYVETMEDMLNKWVGESVSQITTMPKDYLAKIHDIIIWGYNTHQPMVNVYRRLQKATGATKSQARMLARDQMGTLNCRMTQYEHESLGVTQYRWVTKHDSRVRDCHRSFDGRVFSWNNPPAEWYGTIGRGVIYTGRYINPGEAYCCRCVAKPVFDEDRALAAINEQRWRSVR